MQRQMVSAAQPLHTERPRVVSVVLLGLKRTAHLARLLLENSKPLVDVRVGTSDHLSTRLACEGVRLAPLPHVRGVTTVAVATTRDVRRETVWIRAAVHYQTATAVGRSRYFAMNVSTSESRRGLMRFPSRTSFKCWKLTPRDFAHSFAVIPASARAALNRFLRVTEALVIFPYQWSR